MADNIVVGTLRALLTLDSAKFDQGIRHAQDGLKKFSAETKILGRQATELGASLTRTLTLPILGFGGAVAKAAIDFESSFAGIRKTVNASEAEFAKLAKGMRDLSKEIPINVNELNKIGEAAGQLGIKTENILGFTKVMAQLGVTTNLSSDQAATALARLANITGMPQTEFDKLGSTIVDLGNNFATTEAEIVEFGLRIAGAGTQARMSEADILAIGAALSSVGVEAEAGGTAVQKVILDMVKAVAQGNEDLAVFARTAGMTAEQFRKTFAADSAGAFTAFVEGLGKAGDQAINILAKLGLEDQRLIRSFLGLANAGDLLRRSIETGNVAWRENSALSIEAGRRFETTASQLTKLWNRFKDVGITIGNAFLPLIKASVNALTAFLPVIEKVAGAFAALPVPVQAVVVGLGLITAAIGPMVYVFGQLLLASSAIAGAFATKGIAARLLAGQLGVLSTAALVAGRAISVIGVAFTSWQVGKWLGDITGLTDRFGKLASVYGEFLGILPKGTVAQYDAMRAAQRAADAAGVQATATEDLAAATATLPEPLRAAMAATEGADAALQQWASTLGTSKEKVSEFEQAVRSLTERIGGTELVKSVNVWLQAIERVGGIGALTRKELEDFTQAIADAVEKMLLLGQVVPASWMAIANTIRNQPLLGATQDMLGKSLDMFGGINRQPLLLQNNAIDPRALMVPPQVFSQGISATVGPHYLAQLRQTFTQVASAIPDILQQAFMGGGGVSGAIKATGTMLGSGLATSVLGGWDKSKGMITNGLLAGFKGWFGQFVSSAIPVVGALLGPLMSKIGGFFKNVFGGGEEGTLVNPARDRFLAQFGPGGTGIGSGFHNLAARLTEITGEEGGGQLFRALTQADTMSEFNAAVAAIERKLNETHETNTDGFDSASDAADGLNVAITGSDEALAELGRTQDRVVQAMLAGFDRIIGKIDQMVSALASAMGLSVDLANAIPSPSTPGTSPGSDPTSPTNPFDGGPIAPPDVLPFHSGRRVSLDWVRAHRGLRLSSDEVPIIAQVGERVLSRSETEVYEGGSRASTGGGLMISIGQVVTKDAGSFVRELPVLVRQNRHGLRSELRTALGVT